MLLKRLITYCLLLLIPSLAAAKIVFIAYSDGRHPNVHIMNDDGSNIQDVTFPPHRNGKPAWSPDGKRIAFLRDMPREPKAAQKAAYSSSIVMAVKNSSSPKVQHLMGIVRGHLMDAELPSEATEIAEWKSM